MTDTLSLLFDLQKKTDHIKVQIESLKKLNTGGESNSQLSSTLDKLNEKLTSIVTLSQFEERYNDLVEYILNGSSLVECDEIIDLVNELKSKIESDHEKFSLSIDTLESINSSITTINANILQIKTYYEMIMNTLAVIDVQTSDTYNKLVLETNTIKTRFSEVGTTLTSIQEMVNRIYDLEFDINSIYQVSTEVLRKTDTIISNQENMLSLIQNGSNSSGGGNSTQPDEQNACCQEVNNQLLSLNNKVNLILESMNIDYEDTPPSQGGDDEYIEPDNSEELTNTTSFSDFNYYSGTPTTVTDKNYFRCNAGSMLVICFDAFIGAQTSTDLKLDLYLNDNIIQTYNFSAITSENVSLSFVTTCPQEFNTLHLVLTDKTGSIFTYINTTKFTLYGKNAEAISGDDDYQIFTDYNTYTITKNTKDFCGYAIYDPTTEFDQNALSYKTTTKWVGRYAYAFGGIVKKSYNVREEGKRGIIRAYRKGLEYDQLDGDFKIKATRPSTYVADVTNCAINSNGLLVANLLNNVVSIEAYKTDPVGTLSGLQGTPSNISFETNETPHKVTIVKMTTSPTINAYNPSVIMTSTTGNNFFNHNNTVSDINKVVNLGYGTRVKACYLNDALNIGVFMKVYGTFILKRLCPNRDSRFATNTNLAYVSYYTLDDKVIEIGKYDEIHPGRGGEYFTVKDGKIEKHTLPTSILEEVAFTYDV